MGQAISSTNRSDNRPLWVLFGTQGARQAEAGQASDYFVAIVARAPVHQEEPSPGAGAAAGAWRPTEPDDNTFLVGFPGGGAEGEGRRKCGPLTHLRAWGSGPSPTGVAAAAWTG